MYSSKNGPTRACAPAGSVMVFSKFDFRVPVRGLDAERSAESQKLLAVLLNISLVEVGLLEPLVAVVEISTEQGPRGVGVDSLVAWVRRSQRSGRQETGKDGLEFHLSACEETGEKTSERCLLKREKSSLVHSTN